MDTTPRSNEDMRKLARHLATKAREAEMLSYRLTRRAFSARKLRQIPGTLLRFCQKHGIPSYGVERAYNVAFDDYSRNIRY